VIGCGCWHLDTQEAIQFAHEFSNKLQLMIRDHGFWKAMELPHMLKVQSGRAQSCDGGVSGDEVTVPGSQVYHNHGSVETM
jgi:hypothetical protein